MKNSSPKLAEELLNEMRSYYHLAIKFSSEVQLSPFEKLMRSWRKLEEKAAKCEKLMGQLEKNPVEDAQLNNELLEQAGKNSALMNVLSRSLDKEKGKVMDELCKFSSSSSVSRDGESSFGYSL